MKKQIQLGSVALVVAALLFSLDGLLRRHLYTLPAPVIVFYEHLLGALVLAPIVLLSFKAFKTLTRKQWYAITGVALLSGAIGTILYTAALGRVQYIPFSVVVLLQQLNPVFAIGASALLLGEPISRRFFGLSAVALVGAYFVTFPHLSVTTATGAGTLIGGLFAVGAAASWGTSTAFSKYALRDTPFIHVTALRFAITPFFALLFVLISGSAKSMTAITLNQFWYLLAITFSTGMIALVIYYYGLQRILASRAALLELAWPVSSVVIGYLFLHQGLTVTQAIGGLTLTGTMYLIAKDAEKTQPEIESAAKQTKAKRQKAVPSKAAA